MTAIVTHVFLALGAGDALELPRHNLQPRPPHLRWRPKSKGLVVVCRGAWFLGQCLGIEDCCEISRRKEVEVAGRRAVDAGTSTIGVASMLRLRRDGDGGNHHESTITMCPCTACRIGMARGGLNALARQSRGYTGHPVLDWGAGRSPKQWRCGFAMGQAEAPETNATPTSFQREECRPQQDHDASTQVWHPIAINYH